MRWRMEWFPCDYCGRPVMRPNRSDRRKLHPDCVVAWWFIRVYPASQAAQEWRAAREARSRQSAEGQ